MLSLCTKSFVKPKLKSPMFGFKPKSRHDEEHRSKMVAGKSERAVSKVKLGRRKLFELPILLLIQATLKMMENAHARAFAVRRTMQWQGEIRHMNLDCNCLVKTHAEVL